MGYKDWSKAYQDGPENMRELQAKINVHRYIESFREEMKDYIS